MDFNLLGFFLNIYIYIVSEPETSLTNEKYMSNRQIVGVKILNPPNRILLGLLASIKKQYV